MSLLELRHADFTVGQKKILDDPIKINETVNLNGRYSCSMSKSRALQIKASDCPAKAMPAWT